jgi:hypothetical protein
MRKKFDKKDWKTWGVEDLIPESVLEQMVATPGFDVNYVRKAARSHLGRIAWSYDNRETYLELLNFKLEILSADPAGDNLIALGQILEYAFIIKNIEGALRKQYGSSLGSENLTAEEADELAQFRASLRAVKSKLMRKKNDTLSNGRMSQPEMGSRIQVCGWEPDIASQRLSRFHN